MQNYLHPSVFKWFSEQLKWFIVYTGGSPIAKITLIIKTIPQFLIFITRWIVFVIFFIKCAWFTGKDSLTVHYLFDRLCFWIPYFISCKRFYRSQYSKFNIKILGCSLRIYFFTVKLYRSAQDLYKKCRIPTSIRSCKGNETWKSLPWKLSLLYIFNCQILYKNIDFAK